MGRWQANMGRDRRIRNGGGPAQQQDRRGGSSFAASSPCPHVQRDAIGRLYIQNSPWGGGGHRLNDEALRVPRSLGAVCVPNIHHHPRPTPIFPAPGPYRPLAP